MNGEFINIRSVFSLFGIVVLSWLLIHILGVFGIFLAIAYPIWWFFAPRQTPCFLCRTKGENTPCMFCRRTSHGGNKNPTNIISVLANSFVIILFTAISLTVIFAESKALTVFGFPMIHKTATFTIPERGQFRIGEIFPMKLEIAGIETPINTVQADIGFDPNRLEVVDIRTDESFAQVFIQKEINNQSGYARLTGGIPSPGFKEKSGFFGTVYFKGRTAGLTNIHFLPSSLVLANDGAGTNILKSLASASYVIKPERVTLEEEELQTEAMLTTEVLGADEKKSQLTFFEETDVLGITDDKEFNIHENQHSILHASLVWLEKFDSMVLRKYAELVEILFSG